MQAGQVSSSWLDAGPPARVPVTRPGSPRSAATRDPSPSNNPTSASGATISASWSAINTTVAARRATPGTPRRADRGLGIARKATPPPRRPPVDRLPARPRRCRSTRLPDRPLGRQNEPERAPLAEDRLDADGAAVELDELLAERQPEPGPLLLPAGRAVHLAEDLEEPSLVLGPDADAAAAHRACGGAAAGAR